MVNADYAYAFPSSHNKISSRPLVLKCDVTVIKVPTGGSGQDFGPQLPISVLLICQPKD